MKQYIKNCRIQICTNEFIIPLEIPELSWSKIWYFYEPDIYKLIFLSNIIIQTFYESVKEIVKEIVEHFTQLQVNSDGFVTNHGNT